MWTVLLPERCPRCGYERLIDVSTHSNPERWFCPKCGREGRNDAVRPVRMTKEKDSG